MGDVGTRIALGVAIVVGMTTFAADPADAAAVLCQRKAKVRVRDGACKAKETQVQLSGASVETATLPQVPSAAEADSSGAADSATTATDGDAWRSRSRTAAAWSRIGTMRKFEAS